MLLKKGYALLVCALFGFVYKVRAVYSLVLSTALTSSMQFHCSTRTQKCKVTIRLQVLPAAVGRCERGAAVWRLPDPDAQSLAKPCAHRAIISRPVLVAAVRLAALLLRDCQPERRGRSPPHRCDKAGVVPFSYRGIA